MRILVHHFARLLGSLALATVAFATSSEIPPHGAAIALFDGRDLTNFDILLKEHGLNNDPDHVFRVENGVIHVSGKEFGYVITKQEFANYYLRAEFKWGEGTRGPRARQRNSLPRARPAESLADLRRVSDYRRRYWRLLDDGWRRVDRAERR